MSHSATCSGCGQYFASGDAVACTVTMNYAEYCVTDDYCFECKHEINRAIVRMHKKEKVKTNG